jgi:hypothetical protein
LGLFKRQAVTDNDDDIPAQDALLPEEEVQPETWIDEDVEPAKAKKRSRIKKEEPDDENIVYDWMTGEEVGSVRNVITNDKGATISYEVKSLADNIIQYSSSQIDLTDEGYILLPIWLSKAREYRDRLSDASRKLGELRRMLDNNTISLETYTEMAKVTFNFDLLEGCDRSVLETGSMLSSIRDEKGRIEQEIYSLDIKRRVGIMDRVEYSKASIELVDSYKRVLYHIAETESLQKELVQTVAEAKTMEEVPGGNLESLRERKYRLHFVLSSNPLVNVQVKKVE